MIVADAVTSAWVRNPSDEKAVANGCRFDVERAAYGVWWIERYCRLYEGEQAGQPLILHGCHQCGDYGLPASETFATWEEARETALLRAQRHAECVRLGHRIDWQYECLMRLLGWVKYSEKWRREVRRFRQGSIWIAKKNKKSPTLAAVGLYLTCGDGEPGQKTFLGAKDGNQARDNCGKHTVEMVKSSPELAAECSVNLNLMQITHEPSRSILRPLSSSNSRVQEGKEGLNGSVLIDETHVVDREFIGRLSRAGISRSEPLQLEVSTAGSDPESYGKERFDFAQAVERGEQEAEQLFVAIYAAPQDLTDEDLAADPLKYGRMANPAMGHTVDPAEYLQDYQQSKSSPAELGRFKMYRCNIWQASGSPWLNMSAWAACRRNYRAEDLRGDPCTGGLDLGKTRDTCSLALTFRGDEEGEFRQLVWYWLPRARAELLRDKVGYLLWAREGWIKLTEGNTVDYAVIRRDLIALAAAHQITKLAYDDCYAEQLVQRLIEEDGAFALDQVVAFGQTIRNFAGPTDLYEGLVLEGKLHHNGNPVLTWQAGNTTVKTDVNNNKRPIKQRFGADVRTIDGVVAGIMALELAQAIPAKGPTLSFM